MKKAMGEEARERSEKRCKLEVDEGSEGEREF